MALSKELQKVKQAILRIEMERYPSSYNYMMLYYSIRDARDVHKHHEIEGVLKGTVRDLWKNRLEMFNKAGIE